MASPQRKKKIRPFYDRRKRGELSSNIKRMLAIFSDCEGIVVQEFIPPSQTVNPHYYRQSLRSPMEEVGRQRLK
jgi:hypothetical protein